MEKTFEEKLKQLKFSDPVAPGHARFAALICQYPNVAALWDWEERVMRATSFDRVLPGLSHGEKILLRFFEMIWNHDNRGFDLADAAGVLDLKERKMIADWLVDPFWP